MRVVSKCATFAIVLLNLSFSSAAAQSDEGKATTHTLMRPDNSKVIFYLNLPASNRKAPLLISFQGSQPESVYDHKMLSLEFSQRWNVATLMIEKPGVATAAQDCSEEYKNKNTLDARLSDALFVLNSLKDSNWWDGTLTVLGGSEGGALAAKLTAVYPVNKAVLLVTGAGITLAEAMPDLVRGMMQGAPPKLIQDELDKIPDTLRDIKKNPVADKSFGGHCNTYKYWNSVLWYRPSDTMLKTKTEYLLVHGDNDINHPVESARKTAKLFKDLKINRLTYWELPGLDHGFQDEQGKSRMNEIIDSSLEWAYNH